MNALLYAGLAVDRAADLRRNSTALAAALASGEARLLPYWRGRSLIGDGPCAVAACGTDAKRLAAAASHLVFLGRSPETAWFAADLSALEGGDHGPDLALPGRFLPLIANGGTLPAQEAALLAYARGMLHWHSRHLFCGACGGPTTPDWGGHVRRCTNCKAEHFPRTDPAIIVLVTDGDRCLLGRQASWPAGMYSCLAGFVEPGESLEEATAREVLEETGILVADIKYMASQPWPFPSSLMVGFRARAVGGELRIDSHELEDARWFDRDEVRAFDGQNLFLPRRDSIARWLIERWLA